MGSKWLLRTIDLDRRLEQRREILANKNLAFLAADKDRDRCIPGRGYLRRLRGRQRDIVRRNGRADVDRLSGLSGRLRQPN